MVFMILKNTFFLMSLTVRVWTNKRKDFKGRLTKSFVSEQCEIPLFGCVFKVVIVEPVNNPMMIVHHIHVVFIKTRGGKKKTIFMVVDAQTGTSRIQKS